MPVYRTPDGRIVEEKTTLKPRRDTPEPAANGTAPGGAPDAAAEKRRGTAYTEPTVVRRPGRTSAGPAAPREDEPTRLAGAVPTATISLGDTKLLFVAFCGDAFGWSNA